MKSTKIILVLVLFCVANVSAYHCLFSGSEYYPAENKAFCAANDPGGNPMNGCDYSYFYYQQCMDDCCEAAGGERVDFSSEAPYLEVDTSSVDYQLYHNCAGEGKCIMMGYNDACVYPYNAQEDKFEPINGAQVENCIMDCIVGQPLPGKGSGSAYNVDEVPPTLRSCVCNYVEELYGYTCEGGVEEEIPVVTPHEEEKDPCEGVVCEKVCVIENNVPTLYYDGVCEAEGSAYDCYYSKGECELGCNPSGDGCDISFPLDITIQTPADGSNIDTASTGVAYVNISGFVSGWENYNANKVIITINMVESREAVFDESTGWFYLNNVEVMEGKPTRITAGSYDQLNRHLGSETVVVYPSPKLRSLLFSCKQGATMYRNSEELPCDDANYQFQAQDGDTIQLIGNGQAVITYTDGTKVTLKAPATITFWEKSVYVTYGAIEVEVSHDYEILGRMGYYVVKGTNFEVIVPEYGPETLIVYSGTVAAALQDSPGYSIDVYGGEMLVLDEGLYLGEGIVQTSSDTECCGSSFILLAVLGFLFYNSKGFAPIFKRK